MAPMWRRRLDASVIFLLLQLSAPFEISEYGTSGEHPRCLDTKETVLLPNLTRDVRLDPVLLVQRSWLSHCLATQTARIVLEELLNQQTVLINNPERYSVYVYDDVACRAQGEDCPEPEWQFDADIESWQVFPFSDKHRKFVDTDGMVAALPLGFSGRPGIYFAPYEAAPNPWDSWDFYKRHWDERVLAEFPQAGTVDVLEVFNGNGEASGYCGESWNERYPISTGPAWCTEGRYVPPVCQSNVSACRELYHANIYWDQGHVEQMIRNLNLKYVVSYITPKFDEVLREMTRKKPAVYCTLATVWKLWLK